MTMDPRPLFKLSTSLLLSFDDTGAIVRLFSSDTNSSILLTRPGNVATEAIMPVDAITRKLPLESARLIGNALSCGGSVPLGTDATGYPPVPTFTPGTTTIATAELARLVNETCYAISSDERYGLNGTSFEVADGTLRMVATDGSRLSLAECHLDGTLTPPARTLIPRILSDVVKLFTGNTVELSYSKKHLHLSGIHAPGWTAHVALRLVDGEFPAYRSVIPSRSPGSIVVARADLLTAVRACLPFAADRAHTIGVAPDPTGAIYLHARSVATGERHVKVNATVSGPVPWEHVVDKETVEFEYQPPYLGFDAEFLIDVLANRTDTEITLSVGEALAPCVIPGSSGSLSVVMPIRTDLALDPSQYHGETLEKPAAKVAKKTGTKVVPPVVPAYPDLRAEVAQLHADLARAVIAREELADVRAELTRTYAGIENRDETIADLRARLAALQIAPAPVVESIAAVVDVHPATTPEEAMAAYRLARTALDTNDRKAMARARAALPTWPSKKAVALRTEIDSRLSA
jgi:DNA polymerase III sliding clamp (beta) subunit (PCNA family)